MSKIPSGTRPISRLLPLINDVYPVISCPDIPIPVHRIPMSHQNLICSVRSAHESSPLKSLQKNHKCDSIIYIYIIESHLWFFCKLFNGELSWALLTLQMRFWWDIGIRCTGIGISGQEITGYTSLMSGNNREIGRVPDGILLIYRDFT